MASNSPTAKYPELLYVSPEEKAALMKARAEKQEKERKEKIRVERNEVALKDKTRLEEGLLGLQSAIGTLKEELGELDDGISGSRSGRNARDLISLAALVETGLKVIVLVAEQGVINSSASFRKSKATGLVTLMSGCRGWKADVAFCGAAREILGSNTWHLVARLRQYAGEPNTKLHRNLVDLQGLLHQHKVAAQEEDGEQDGMRENAIIESNKRQRSG